MSANERVEWPLTDRNRTVSRSDFAKASSGHSPSLQARLVPPKHRRREGEWTLDDRIRTLSEFEVQDIVFALEPYVYMKLASTAIQLRELGHSYRVIGQLLGVDDKQARKAVAYARKAKREGKSECGAARPC